ncbi:MAG: amidohydrolase [Pirellulales bacterium]
MIAIRWLLMVMIVAVPMHAYSQTINQDADLILAHGKLFGVADKSADSIAIKDNRIVAVGGFDQIVQLHPRSKIIEAAGATITPGIHDSHVHFLSGSLSLSQIELSQADDIDKIEAKIRDFMKAHPDQPVVMGRGWLYGAFPGGLPTKEILDRLIPDRPAIMRCYDGHTVWVNSKAIEAAGITRDTHDPKAGVIVRDAKTGELTGVFKESAQNLIEKIIPQPTRDENLAALRLGIAHAHRLGITSVCEAGVGLTELDLLDSLRASGELDLRYAIALEGKPGMTEDDFEQLESLRSRFPKLNIQAVKLYIDGVIEAHTAALLNPYTNRDSLGMRETDRADLNRVIGRLDKQGWQVMVHAVGDGGVRMTLDAMELAIQQNSTPIKGRRHRLEHIETISQDDIPRLGKLGILASMQPYHANPNSNIFNVWAVNLGPERAARAWAWNSIRNSGGLLAFGSDWPVVSLDPRMGLHVAVTRQTLDGKPEGGFVSAERLKLEPALEAYTSGAAYAQFAESNQGSLEVGYLADIVVWDRDLLAEPEKIQFAKAKYTIFDGKLVN